MPSFLATLGRDLRYAARTLRKAPAFSVTAILVLAVGIGANSAMFSLVDAVLLRPLPFPQADRLALLWEVPPGRERNRVSPLNFLDWSEQNRSFSAMAAVSGGRRTLTGASGEPEQIQGQSVTTTWFDVLGVHPLLGRTFTPEDNKPGANVVVLSEQFWERRFGRDTTLIGRTITLDDQPITVIGIAPASAQVLAGADFWMPFIVTKSPEQRAIHFLQVVGRLKPGATLDQARADMAGIARHIAEISPSTNRNWGVLIQPLQEGIVGRDLRLTSFVLAAVVAFVLLMACANVANLMLARGLGRRREIAVRTALGGSRGRIVQQLVTESLLLASIGGAAGVALSWLVVRAAPTFLPPGALPGTIVMQNDARMLIFAVAVTLTTGLLFGLAPAWQAMRVSLTDAIGSGARLASRGTGALRTLLVIGQVATAVLLVAGAGLLVRTLVSINSVDPGYRHNDVLTMAIGLSNRRYPTPDHALKFLQQVEREVATLPGVRSAAIGGNVPLDGWNVGMQFTVVGDPPIEPGHVPSAHYQMVGPRYFETLGIDILQGRAFSDRDISSAPQVCIVNEAFVRKHLGGRAPMGMRLNVSAMNPKGPTDVQREIVGVIRQVRVQGPTDEEGSEEIYVPLAQNNWFFGTLVIRPASGDPLALTSAAKAAIARVDKQQPVGRVRTMADVAAGATARPRFRATLVGGFAALALALAAVGIFGVLAVSVNQRTREFGIRLALGAHATDVLRIVVGNGLRMVAIGAAIGLMAAALMTRLLESLLFRVQPLDPITFLAAPALLVAIALAACAAPALRAARVDPAVTLRQD